MKLHLKIPVLLFSLLLMNSYAYAQNKKKDIMLTVDVDNITAENLEETCSFGQGDNISNEDFTTIVTIGDEVKWKIDVLDSSRGSAKLVKYKHENGPKFFNADSISVKNNRIKGTIEEGAGTEGDTEKYTLEFKIKKQGTNEWITYAIDPKLKLSL